jgi:hypothetical protein
MLPKHSVQSREDAQTNGQQDCGGFCRVNDGNQRGRIELMTYFYGVIAVLSAAVCAWSLKMHLDFGAFAWAFATVTWANAARRRWDVEALEKDHAGR